MGHPDLTCNPIDPNLFLTHLKLPIFYLQPDWLDPNSTRPFAMSNWATGGLIYLNRKPVNTKKKKKLYIYLTKLFTHINVVDLLPHSLIA